MYELIEIYNTDKTHIEIDTVNQKENGTTTDGNLYSYTIYLTDNESDDPINMVSVEKFNSYEVGFVIDYFDKYLKKRDKGKRTVAVRLDGDR
ncbi:hypothetical protein [Candidatus Enterococcus ikei]|uniref:Uncharacterized protein n=1 Tax=Candidatus Enterococcus ikei TaxID=2815326 RepID=A0ABS3GUK6_9ENTE|nr:hypothetical protein [Enterococcus sp. DIV0869a]MBO0438945.1 hypothetical protein [Enterococcus sp. DIV0869a]